MSVFDILIKISTFLILGCVSSAADRSVGNIGQSIRISKEEKLKSLKDPKSCESVYYRLGEQRKITATQNDLQTQFKNARLLFNEKIDKQVKELRAPQSSMKLQKEIDAVHLDIYSAPLKRGEQGAMMQYKYADVPNRMQINRRAFENRPEAVNAFWMGHEFSHATDWIPPQVAECLGSPTAYGARQNGISKSYSKDKDLEIFWKHFQSISGKLPASGQIQLNLETNHPEETGGGFVEGSGTDSITKFETLAKYDPNIGHLLVDILEGKKKFTSLSKREVENLNQIVTAVSNNHHLGLEKFLGVSGNHWLDGSYKWIQELPDQTDEAFADYQGTLLAVDFINKKMKTPAEKKEAALAILRSFPPELYTDKVHSLMSRVGSKKPNEDRALRILLANPEFRSFLDCEFETKPEPKFCPLVAPKKPGPIQNFFKRVKEAVSTQ